MRMSLATLAVLSVIATPAFAQSFDPEAGSGNVLPSYYGPDGALHAGIFASPNDKSAVRHSGMHASALVTTVRKNGITIRRRNLHAHAISRRPNGSIL